MTRWRRWPMCLLVGTILAGGLCYGLVDRIVAPERALILSESEVQKRLEWDKTNYSQIDEGLWLGALVPRPPPGTRAVLNVCQSRDPYRAEQHRWDPIEDADPPPSLLWLWDQVEFIDAQRRAGLQVYVHCHEGISRGPMVVTAYLMARSGWSRDQALEKIRAKRSWVRPHPAFMELLLQWEALVNEYGFEHD